MAGPDAIPTPIKVSITPMIIPRFLGDISDAKVKLKGYTIPILTPSRIISSRKWYKLFERVMIKTAKLDPIIPKIIDGFEGGASTPTMKNEIVLIIPNVRKSMPMPVGFIPTILAYTENMFQMIPIITPSMKPMTNTPNMRLSLVNRICGVEFNFSKSERVLCLLSRTIVVVRAVAKSAKNVHKINKKLKP